MDIWQFIAGVGEDEEMGKKVKEVFGRKADSVRNALCFRISCF